MFQRIVYTILVDRGGHITSCTHHVFGRISHSNPNPDMAKHLNIITTITKGHTFVQTDMVMFQHFVNPDPFTASKRYDICKKRVHRVDSQCDKTFIIRFSCSAVKKAINW